MPAWGARPAVPLCIVLTLLMLHTICSEQGMPHKCEHPLTDALRTARSLLLALPLLRYVCVQIAGASVAGLS